MVSRSYNNWKLRRGLRPEGRKDGFMVAFAEWFPLLTVGVTFTTLGLLKVYGLRRGVVGGGGKPYKARLLGSCPTWSRHLNIAMPCVFLAIGLLNFSVLAWKLIAAK